MKKLIIITILFTAFVLNKVQAQTNSTLDRFSNTTWVWTNGTDSLKIYLKKASITPPNYNGPAFETLTGFHYFKKGNTVIENSCINLRSLPDEYKWTILLNNDIGGVINDLEGTFRHTSKNKTISLKFTVDATGTNAFLSVKNTEGTKISPYDSSISLPNNITLTKAANEITPRPTRRVVN
jgi:hypothetical protein